MICEPLKKIPNINFFYLHKIPRHLRISWPFCSSFFSSSLHYPSSSSSFLFSQMKLHHQNFHLKHTICKFNPQWKTFYPHLKPIHVTSNPTNWISTKHFIITSADKITIMIADFTAHLCKYASYVHFVFDNLKLQWLWSLIDSCLSQSWVISGKKNIYND